MDIPLLMGQILFLSGVVVAGLLIHRLLRLEQTLACLLAGMLGAYLLPLTGIDTGIRASNIQSLTFYIILPLLIFEAAWHIQPSILKRWLLPVLLLSTLGLLLSSIASATILYFGIGVPSGFPWVAALLTGAILAATDPIAVVSALKRLSASEDLGTLVESESLFNDATALVLFGAILSFASGDEARTGVHLGLAILSTFFGGLLVGGVIGCVAALLVKLLAEVAQACIVLIVCAFSAFYIAEHFFHVSGILAVVGAAMASRVLLKSPAQPIVAALEVTWNWLGTYLNSMIFVLMGLVITYDMFLQQWLAMLIAIPAALLGRALAVYGCGLLLRPLRSPLAFGWQHILVWGGLRGAIAVVLVLSLPISLPYWYTVQSMVFGVVLFALLVQGTTAGLLIKRYGA